MSRKHSRKQELPKINVQSVIQEIGRTGRIFDSQSKTIVQIDLKKGHKKGGNGLVYFGLDRQGKEVAIKIYSRFDRNGRINPQDISRFNTEYKACQKISHPNIMKVFEYGVCNVLRTGLPFYTMPIGRETLSDYIVRTPTTAKSVKDKLIIFTKILLGVSALHQNNIKCHRDIKPQNILLDNNGNPWISDLGIAKINPELMITLAQTQAHEKLRNQSYYAPEQTNPSLGDIGPHTDVFSLGYVFHELLTGYLPRGSVKLEAYIKEIQPFQFMLSKMLEENISIRYSTIDDLFPEYFSASMRVLNNYKMNFIVEKFDHILSEQRGSRFNPFELRSKLLNALEGETESTWLYDGHSTGFQVKTFAGNGDFGQLDGDAIKSSFNMPSGIAVGGKDHPGWVNAGYIYIADRYNNKIRQISPSGEVRTLEYYLEKHPNPIEYAPEFLKDPIALCAAQGNLFIADHERNCIVRLVPRDRGGEIYDFILPLGSQLEDGSRGKFISEHILAPRGLALYRRLREDNQYDLELYVTQENNLIVKFTIDFTYSHMESEVLAGKIDLSGFQDGPVMEALFNKPTGIVVSNEGEIFVCDTQNHRVRKIRKDGIVVTVAGTGACGHKDGESNTCEFNSPTGIEIDESNNLFIADSGNHCIRRISHFGLVTTIAGQNDPGYQDGSPLSSKFNVPYCLTMDKKGNLLICEHGNSRIRKLLMYQSPLEPHKMARDVFDEISKIIFQSNFYNHFFVEHELNNLDGVAPIFPSAQLILKNRTVRDFLNEFGVTVQTLGEDESSLVLLNLPNGRNKSINTLRSPGRSAKKWLDSFEHSYKNIRERIFTLLNEYNFPQDMYFDL